MKKILMFLTIIILLLGFMVGVSAMTTLFNRLPSPDRGDLDAPEGPAEGEVAITVDGVNYHVAEDATFASLADGVLADVVAVKYAGAVFSADGSKILKCDDQYVRAEDVVASEAEYTFVTCEMATLTYEQPNSDWNDPLDFTLGLTWNDIFHGSYDGEIPTDGTGYVALGVTNDGRICIFDSTNYYMMLKADGSFVYGSDFLIADGAYGYSTVAVEASAL